MSDLSMATTTIRQEQDKQFRRLVITVVSIVILSDISLIVFNLVTEPLNKFVLLLLGGVLLVSFVLAFRNILMPARILVPLSLSMALIHFALEGSGFHDVSALGFAGVIVLAGLMLGEWGVLIFGLLTIAINIGLGLAESSGLFIPRPPETTNFEDIGVKVILILATGFTLYALVRRMNNLFNKTRQSEQAQIQANIDLNELRNSLEQRVTERTTELEQANQQIQKRAQQLQIISEVARTISTEQDPNRLLEMVSNLVSERFGFYHVGIFLIDSAGKYAVLRASNSQGGKKMLKRGHRLEVGQTGIVGFVSASAKPRIALDVGEDAAFFDNPDLPETRSEMALPLRIRERVTGVLDVQSTQPGAFSEADIYTLEILADQVAIAIENAKLISETQRVLSETQMLYRQYLAQAWGKSEQGLSYLHKPSGGMMLAEPVEWEEAMQSLATGEAVVIKSDTDSQAPAVAIPIKIRDRVLGVLDVRASDPSRQWSQDEINMLRAVADRLALALENARLFEETSSRATRERIVTDITTKIRSAADPQAMLQTALDELRRVLQAGSVQVHTYKPNVIRRRPPRTEELPAPDPDKK